MPTSVADSFDGQSPTLFVGRFGYPHVSVGLLSTPQYTDHDDPRSWVRKSYSIEKIMTLRQHLINSRFSSDVRKPTSPLIQTAQEVAAADRPTDVSVHLAHSSTLRLSTPAEVIPFGPSINLLSATITSNTHIPVAVDAAIGDTDVTASTALHELSNKGYDEHYLTRLLSAGTLGKQRRLVPTRWSTTAVDDTLSKQLLTTIKTYDTAPFQAYSGGYLGNEFIILFFDELFGYELFERYEKSTAFTTDYEPFTGRKAYAEQTAGGYYAARLAITQHLFGLRQQAGVLAIRIITDAYHTALGVWVVREAVRNALASTPIYFGNAQLLITYAQQLCKKRWGVSIDAMVRTSKMLYGQRTLSHFSSGMA